MFVCVCVFVGCAAVCVFRPGRMCVGGVHFCPNRVVLRFVWIRRRRTERSSRTQCHGFHIPLAHALMTREHEYSRSLPPSAAPSRPLCPVVSSRASLVAHEHMCFCAGRWHEPRPDRRGACRVVGVLVQYMWRSNGTGVPCHLHSLTNGTRALVGLQPFGGRAFVAEANASKERSSQPRYPSAGAARD